MANKENSIMKGIKEFISTCPCLGTYLDTLRTEVGVEYLDEGAKNYSIESVPVEPIVRRYLDGTSVRRFTFAFTSREAYGKDVVENLANCGFYEKFADWIYKCNLNGEYPQIGTKKEVTKMKCTSTPYVFNVDEMTAKYQIEVTLEYYQESEE